jgi:hypothetical protein
MELLLASLQTARLRLEPLTAETARAILAGDLSGLAAAGLTAADGWPHDDTADGLGMAVGSEAVAVLTEWLLSQPGVRQVSAHTLTSNVPSRRVLRRRASPTSASTKAKPSTSGHKSSSASANLVMTTPGGLLTIKAT